MNRISFIRPARRFRQRHPPEQCGYALARGVNEGWLSPIYGPAAIIGWNGIETQVLPDGRVGGICEGTKAKN